MQASERVIHIEPLAPAKPRPGAACNGCGVCCLFAPCPLGMLLSGRRRGACVALRWAPAARQYRCGALTEPAEVMRERLPGGLAGLAPALGAALGAWAPRWIASGVGCDSSLEVESTAGMSRHDGKEGARSGAQS